MSYRDVESLLDICRSGNPDEQIEAVNELVDLQAYTVVSEIMPLLASPHPIVRSTTVDALRILGEDDAENVGALLSELLKDPSGLVRSSAATSIGFLRYQGATELLGKLAQGDPDWMARSSAAEALGSVGDVSVLPLLFKVLHEDTDKIVRADAAASIGLLASPKARRKLEAYITSRQEKAEVIIELLGACYRLGSQPALQNLLNFISTIDDETIASRLLIMLQGWVVAPPKSLGEDVGTLLDKPLRMLAQRFPAQQIYVESVLWWLEPGRLS